MSEIFTYDSKEWVFQLSGVRVEGFGDGSILTITKNDDMTILEEGVNGDHCFSFSNKTSGTAEITLKYGSKWDGFFDNALTFGSKGILPYTFLHPKSFKFCTGVCMVKEQPATVLGETPEDRTWVLNLSNATMAVSESVKAIVSGVKFGVEEVTR